VSVGDEGIGDVVAGPEAWRTILSRLPNRDQKVTAKNLSPSVLFVIKALEQPYTEDGKDDS